MSNAKRYYWLKLQDDFFNSKRIKKLRKLAGGDTFTIIYLKMQLHAMKQGGVLVYTGLEPTFAEELALDLDEDEDNVAITVNYLLSCGLLETSDEREYFVPYAVLNTGSEGSSTKRVREHRERKALQSNNDVTPLASLCNVEKEIEKDKEIEIETDREKKTNYQQIVDMYNETCVSLSRVRSLSDARKKAIKARLNTYTLDDFKLLFEKAEASSFLKGGNNRNWTATFDWLIQDSNMAKVLDGNYDDKANNGGRGRTEIVPKWIKEQPDYNPTAESIKKSGDWLDGFLAEQGAEESPELKDRADQLKKRLAEKYGKGGQ